MTIIPKRGPRVLCISSIQGTKKCPLYGFQLTLSCFCSFHCSQVPSIPSHLYPVSSAIEISGAKTKLRCVGSSKKLGLLSHESWWVQGQHRFWIWSFWDVISLTLFIPSLPGWNFSVHQGTSNRIWVSCFAATFILAHYNAGYSSSSTSFYILKFSQAPSIHLHICRHKVYLSSKM